MLEILPANIGKLEEIDNYKHLSFSSTNFPCSAIYLYASDKRYPGEGSLFLQMESANDVRVLMRRFDSVLRTNPKLKRYVVWRGSAKDILAWLTIDVGTVYGHLVIRNLVESEHEEDYSSISVGLKAIGFSYQALAIRVRKTKYDPWKDPLQIPMFKGQSFR